MTPELRSRLLNWKFDSARELADGMPELREGDKLTIKALAVTFGNSGWFDGHMSQIVHAALLSIGGYAEAEHQDAK